MLQCSHLSLVGWATLAALLLYHLYHQRVGMGPMLYHRIKTIEMHGMIYPPSTFQFFWSWLFCCCLFSYYKRIELLPWGVNFVYHQKGKKNVSVPLVHGCCVVRYFLEQRKSDLIIYDTDAGAVNLLQPDFLTHVYLRIVTWQTRWFIESMCLLNTGEYEVFHSELLCLFCHTSNLFYFYNKKKNPKL